MIAQNLFQATAPPHLTGQSLSPLSTNPRKGMLACGATTLPLFPFHTPKRAGTPLRQAESPECSTPRIVIPEGEPPLLAASDQVVAR